MYCAEENIEAEICIISLDDAFQRHAQERIDCVRLLFIILNK